MENLHALLEVAFRGTHPDLKSEFVIDTGYNGYLTMPPAHIAQLGLKYKFDQYVTLADNTDVKLAVYIATIIWHEELKTVEVFASGLSLLGTSLLSNCEFTAQFIEDGHVSIRAM